MAAAVAQTSNTLLYVWDTRASALIRKSNCAELVQPNANQSVLKRLPSYLEAQHRTPIELARGSPNGWSDGRNLRKSKDEAPPHRRRALSLSRRSAGSCIGGSDERAHAEHSLAPPGSTSFLIMAPRKTSLDVWSILTSFTIRERGGARPNLCGLARSRAQSAKPKCDLVFLLKVSDATNCRRPRVQVVVPYCKNN